MANFKKNPYSWLCTQVRQAITTESMEMKNQIYGSAKMARKMEQINRDEYWILKTLLTKCGVVDACIEGETED